MHHKNNNREAANVWRKTLAGGLSAVMLVSAAQTVPVCADSSVTDSNDLVNHDTSAVPQTAQEAKAAVDAAKANLDHVQEELDKAKFALTEAENAKVSAEQKLNEANTVIQTAKVAVDALKSSTASSAEEAKTIMDTAKYAEKAAKSDKENAKQAWSVAVTAESEAESQASAAAEALTEAQSAYQTAEKAYETAKTEAEKKQSEYQEAKDAYDQMATSFAKAKTTLKAAQADVEKKQNAYDQADQDHREAVKALTEAEDVLAKANTAVETAESNLRQKMIDAYPGKTSLDFFTSLGDTSAADILSTALYKSYTKVGEATDATSLDNMASAIKWMYKLNEIRAAAGLNELPVSSMMMAMAQSDANYSDANIGHAEQFDVGENLAWNNTNNPNADYTQTGAFAQWYTGEKKVFDDTVDNLTENADGTYSGTFNKQENNKVVTVKLMLTSAQVKVLQNVRQTNQISNNDAYNLFSASETKSFYLTVGHYLNVINRDYVVQGFAINNKRTKYPFTYSNVFSFSTSGIGKTYSVAEYEKLFTDYCDKVQVDDQALKQAVKDAETVLSEAKEKQASAQKDKETAESAAKAALFVLETADTALTAANSTLESAKLSYDAMATDIVKAEAALEQADEASQTADKAEEAAEKEKASAIETLTEKQTASDAAKAVYEKKQTETKNAKTAYDEREETYASAVNVAKQAKTAYQSSSEKAARAEALTYESLIAAEVPEEFKNDLEEKIRTALNVEKDYDNLQLALKVAEKMVATNREEVAVKTDEYNRCNTEYTVANRTYEIIKADEEAAEKAAAEAAREAAEKAAAEAAAKEAAEKAAAEAAAKEAAEKAAAESAAKEAAEKAAAEAAAREAAEKAAAEAAAKEAAEKAAAEAAAKEVAQNVPESPQLVQNVKLSKAKLVVKRGKKTIVKAAGFKTKLEYSANKKAKKALTIVVKGKKITIKAKKKAKKGTYKIKVYAAKSPVYMKSAIKTVTVVVR